MSDALAHCFQYLDIHDICAVSLASVEFSSIARRFKFAEVQLRHESGETLRAAIARCRDTLQKASAYRCVQHLRLLPNKSLAIEYRGAVASGPDYDVDGIMEPWKFALPQLAVEDDAPPGSEDLGEEEWQALAGLITELSGLNELTWACFSQVPSSVLDILHERMPHFRLHMASFNLISLNQECGPRAIRQISPEDLAVATSPCLSSLSASAMAYEANSWMSEAIQEMAAGAAPNLRAVNLVTMRDPFEDRHTRWQMQQDAPWKPGTIQLPTVRGSLEHLVLHDMRAKSRLQSWQIFTDLSALHTLRISDKIDDEAMSFLVHNSGEFMNLQDLMIRSDDATQLTCFITSMKPLRRLDISLGGGTDFLVWILEHCNSHLRSLKVDSRANHRIIQFLQTTCPHIENLEMEFDRRGGNAAEVADYDALGAPPALRRLRLVMRSPREPPLDGAEAFNVDVIPRDLVPVLKNMAIDEKLARAIFRRIVAAKMASSPGGPLLERLLIDNKTAVAGNQASFKDLRSMCELIRRSWVCARGTARSDQRPDVRSPTECSVQPYESDGRSYSPIERTPWLKGTLQGPYGHAVLEVWPKCRRGNLANKWHSFPLDESEGVSKQST